MTGWHKRAGPGWAALARMTLAGLLLPVWQTPGLAQGTALAPPPDAVLAAEEAMAAPRLGPAQRAPAPLPIRGVEIAPSALLPRAALDTIAARFVGRSTSAATQGALLAEIEALYAAQGAALARPRIAGIQQGVVRIALDESRAGRVTARGGRPSDAYLVWRLNLAPGTVIDTEALTHRLTRLSLTDGVLIEATFAGGTGAGTFDLGLALSPAPVDRGFILLDTFGKAATGRSRLGFGYTVADLTGWNDPLSISAAISRDSAALALGYRRAVTPGGAQLTVSLDAARSRVPVAPVTTSRSGGAQVGLRFPLVLTEDVQLHAEAGILGFAETGDISGAPLVRQRGMGLRLGLSGQASGTGWLVNAGAALTLVRWKDDVSGGGATNFGAMSVQVAAVRRVLKDWAVSAQVSGQADLGSRAPSRFRFGVAGPGTVRGHDADRSSGDRGVFARLQIERSTPLAIGRSDLLAAPFAFVDAGVAWDRLPGGGYARQSPILSVGLGSTFSLPGRFDGELTLAVPRRQGRWEGVVVHAGLNTRF